VLALRAWLKQARIKTGPVFRRVDRYGFVSRTRGLDPASVAYIVKHAARRAGFRSVRDVSGHSFRSGHVSQAVRNGVPEYVVMKQTGHKSREVLGAYIRMGELFDQNPAAGLWAA
jgi:integrase